MVESRLTRLLLRLGTGLTLAFIYLPLDRHRAVRVQRERHAAVADRRTSRRKLVLGRVPRRGRPRARWSSRCSPRSGRRRSRSSSERSLSLAVARFDFFGREIDHVRGDPPDRAPRHRHGARAAGDHHRRPRPVRRLVRALDDHRRPRDLLHRGRLQQRQSRACAGPPARSTRRPPTSGADSWQTFRYVMFPQMRTALLAGGAACVRALVRRGRRHDLHVGRASRRCRSGSSRPSPGPTEQPIVNVVALFVIVVVDHPGVLRAAARRRRARRRPGARRSRARRALAPAPRARSARRRRRCRSGQATPVPPSPQ